MSNAAAFVALRGWVSKLTILLRDISFVDGENVARDCQIAARSLGCAPKLRMRDRPSTLYWLLREDALGSEAFSSRAMRAFAIAACILSISFRFL